MTQGWHIKNIYLYLVCFVTLLMIVFGLVAFLNNVTRLAFPVNYTYRQTIMDVEREYLDQNRAVPQVTELQQIRDERYEASKSRDLNMLLRDLISSLTVWLIPIPFYLYHWRKVKEDIFADEGGISA